MTAAWDFEKLGRMHAAYMKLLETTPTSNRTRKAGTCAEWFVAEDRAWRAILQVDPLLPAVLLPRNYAGRTVWERRRATLTAVARTVLERV